MARLAASTLRVFADDVRTHELLPELIGLDPWGYPILTPGPVPPGLESLARRTVTSCPALALLLDRPRPLPLMAPASRPARFRQQGAGLAAPQIGVGPRVFAYVVGSERGYLVNPVLEFPDGEEQDGEEGCLSFPASTTT